MASSRVRLLALLVCSAFAAVPAGAGPGHALHVVGRVAYGHDDIGRAVALAYRKVLPR